MTVEASSEILARASIRLRVLVATAVLALGGLWFAGSSLYDALQDRGRAQHLQAASEALAELSRATIDLSLERSVSQLSIEMNVPVTPAIRALIDKQRGKADATFDIVQKHVATLVTTTRIDEFTLRLAALRSKLVPIRQEFDRLSVMPLALRPADVAEHLPRTLKAVVVEFQALRHLLRGVGFLLPTEVAILETVRDQAWQIREFGGRERTYLAVAAFNRGAIRPERLEEMGVLARRASDAWLDIQTLMKHDGLSPGVQMAAAAIGRGYYGTYDQMRSAMLGQAAQPQPEYPSFQAFFTQSSEALGGVETLAYAASAAIDGYWAARASTTLRTVLADAAAGLLLAIGGGLCGWITIGAFRRLDAVRGRMERLAKGDVASEVPDCDAPNEVGAMARALLVFRETARERLGLEEDAARARAAKDRSQSATEQHMRDFTESLAGVMHNLSGAAKRMDTASARMANAAARTGDLARSTTQDATASARDLVMVASATEQLSASVVEISGQVARAASTAQAMTGRASVTEKTMSGLSDAAGRVGNVARLIGAIAGQTNLLALNATIEAARAGAAGKGFAVVAAEVKLLAARTASATGEIGSQIDQIQAATQDAVAAVRQMAADIRQMEEMAAAIAAAVEQQGAGVRDIAGSIASVTRATESAVGAMGESVLSADDARTTSADVREAAAHVGHESDTLGKEVHEFLRNLSADRAYERQHERYYGHDLPVDACFQNGMCMSGGLIDISKGGLAFRVGARQSTTGVTPGMQVAVTLPGVSAPVPMRMVRTVDGVIGLVARQEAGVAEQLTAAIAAVPQRVANHENAGQALAA